MFIGILEDLYTSYPRVLILTLTMLPTHLTIVLPMRAPLCSRNTTRKADLQ